MTQEQFVQAVSINLSRGHLAAIEAGSQSASEALLKVIAQDHGLNLRWLQTGEGSMDAPEAVAREAEEGMRVPILGRVAAGGPYEFHRASPGGTPQLVVDRAIAGRGKRHALEVVGTSMIGAGIQPGDYVICKEGTPVRGDIVIAELPDYHYTLKRWMPLPNGDIELHPANEELEVKTYKKGTVVAKAVVVALVRRYGVITEAGPSFQLKTES